MGAARSGGHTKLLIILGICVALAVALCAGLGIVVLQWVIPGTPPENVRVEITVPEAIEPRSPMTIQVRILNDADRVQTLDSIDIYQPYLSGVMVQSSDPPWNGSMSWGDFISYDFQQRVPANGELIVTFTARSLGEGDYYGDIDVCMNAPDSCLTEVVRTIIAPADQNRE